jgi:altronate dehydratase large subunit
VTYDRMSRDMDINAGRIITGEKSIDQVGEEIFSKMVAVASGEMTKGEAIKYTRSMDFYTLGPVI